MLSEKAARAIREYDGAPERSPGEWPDKIDAVAVLETCVGEPEVVAFLARAVADRSEYDLARIEISKVLRHARFEDDDSHKRCAEALTHVLGDVNDDELVRQWVAMALAGFQSDSVTDLLLRIASDPEEDLDVRHNALGSLRQRPLNVLQTAALEALQSDPHLGAAATRLRSTGL